MLIVLSFKSLATAVERIATLSYLNLTLSFIVLTKRLCLVILNNLAIYDILLLQTCLPIFVDRLRNEITRLTTVKALTLTASSPLKVTN